MNSVNGTAIYARGLTRRFGSFTAVDHIDLDVAPGTIFGLLGANGAGKSTTIRMLCGLLKSSEGDARVAGEDINRRPEAVKRKIGYMSQEFSLYHDLTVLENIQFFGGVYGLQGKHLAERARWVVEMAGLTGREDTLTSTLSGGWRRRLALGCAILHEPPILFLDEPTGGVDPVSRRQFWKLINDLAEEGITVLVTTHYLDEAEYCNSVSLMHAGKIVAAGSPATLKRDQIPFPVWQIGTPEVTKAAEALKTRPEILETAIFGRTIHAVCDCDAPAASTSAGIGAATDHEVGSAILSEILDGAGVSYSSITRTEPSLEDVFIHVIEKHSHDGGAA